jgi:hypothetical protein
MRSKNFQMDCPSSNNMSNTNNTTVASAIVLPSDTMVLPDGVDAPSQPAMKRGPGYTTVEDLILCKAFIAASENPIIGAHQKGKIFKAKMQEVYTQLLNKRMEDDAEILASSSQVTREEYIKQGLGQHYADRTPDSLYNRFKSQIAPDVMRYMGIHETTDMASGWTEENHKSACMEAFKQRYGRVFDYFVQYEYLRTKAKFSSFRTKVDEENLGKRPPGKKKSKQALADAELVKAVIKEVVVKTEPGVEGFCGASVASSIFGSGSAPAAASQTDNNANIDNNVMGKLLKDISNVISGVGSALLENMRAEQDMRLAQSLDTPDRKEFAKEQLKLRVAEAREKRRRLEFNSGEQQNEQSNDF